MRFFIAAISVFLAFTSAKAEDTPEHMDFVIDLVMKNSPKIDSVVYWAMGCTSPCKLKPEYSAGGTESEFRAAAYILVRGQKDLEIKDLTACRSACTILMDLVADNHRKTCVGYDMAWGVHFARYVENGSIFRSEDIVQYKYRAPLIAEWIKKQGGMRPDLRYMYVPSETVEQAYGLCPNTMF
ncbi:hypothetical protein [Rhizobium leguminosarum]|uniref:hypothetical protein n=1 Tax=Rhizobium leguminosarum TaxID=384 RepID=UPI003F9ACA5B